MLNTIHKVGGRYKSGVVTLIEGGKVRRTSKVTRCVCVLTVLNQFITLNFTCKCSPT